MGLQWHANLCAYSDVHKWQILREPFGTAHGHRWPERWECHLFSAKSFNAVKMHQDDNFLGQCRRRWLGSACRWRSLLPWRMVAHIGQGTRQNALQVLFTFNCIHQFWVRLADIMEAHCAELATIESIDSGAVYTLALKTHVGMSIDVWRYFAGWCDKIQANRWLLSQLLTVFD